MQEEGIERERTNRIIKDGRKRPENQKLGFSQKKKTSEIRKIYIENQDNKRKWEETIASR